VIRVGHPESAVRGHGRPTGRRTAARRTRVCLPGVSRGSPSGVSPAGAAMGENRRVPATPSLHDAPARPAEEPDAICAAAVGGAEAAAREIADPGAVGEHLSVVAEGVRTATHFFACTAKGYRGWRWAVTVARASRARHATVSEVVLLPGPDAVLAPVWVPWADRIAPGDLGASDALPYRADDPHLEPGYASAGDEAVDEVALWELGLGRGRVLSAEGRDAAATRWYLGDRGPAADEAVNAAAPCSTCGYWLSLAGPLRQMFGVCANEWSPSDGRVVSVDHGCGAHSETDVERVDPQPLPAPILDETGHEAIVLPPREAPAPDAQPTDAEPPADVRSADADAEPLADAELADAQPLADVDLGADPAAQP